jgi:tetratricopeptide (TPR) repeat protein
MKRLTALMGLLLASILLPLPGQLQGAEEWFERGLSFFRSQRYDDAIMAFSIAIEESPNNSEAYNNRGTTWFYKGDYDQAIADCTKALEINPRYFEAYNNRGTTWFYKSDYDQAIADCTKALEINPRYPDAYNQLALIFAICSDERYLNPNKAVELAKKAVELKPDANFLDTLATAYAEAGRFEDAIATQKRVIALINKEGKTEELAGYLERLGFYEAGKLPREMYAIERQEYMKDAFKRPAAAAVPGAARESMGGKAISAEDEFYPYTIQISSLRDKQRSNRVVKKLRKKGDPAFSSFVRIPGKGDWYRVFIGSYATVEEVKTAALELKKRRFRYVKVVRKPYAIQVGISDSEKELKALEADLWSKGYVVYSMPDRKAQGKTRLLLGAFTTEEEATRLSERLRDEGFSPQVVRR